MKPIQAILFTTAILFMFITSCNYNRINIVNKGNSEYNIIINPDADSICRRAAKTLQQHINLLSKTQLPIQVSSNCKENTLVLSRTPEISNILPLEGPINSDDGFAIKTIDDRLLLTADSGKGLLYAVYSLLEHWGCRYYTPEYKFIPELKRLYLPQLNIKEIPIIKHRECNFINHSTPEFMEWHKLDDHRMEWGMWVHTFDRLVPAKSYFESHPEYFSLVNGKRIANGQLCLSNPEVLHTLVNNLKPKIDANPEFSHWSVSQNDHYNACECKNCKEEYAKFGGYSGALINFVNLVAEQFPEKTISTLAYQYTREAPTNIKPAKNVNVVLCTIEFNRSMPLEADSRSQAFVKDLDDWAKITNDILIWDYTVQYRNLVSPFPNFEVLQPNIQFFVKHGAHKMFQQASGSLWSDFKELKQYTLAKLLWNPDVNTDSIQSDFMTAYYGDAAPILIKYKDLLHQELNKVKKDHFLNIYGYPHDAVHNFLRPEMLDTYSKLFDQAENLAAHNQTILERVQKTRLPLEFAILDISLQNVNDSLRYVLNKDGELTINQPMKDRLDRFTKKANAFGLTKLEEHGLPPIQYHEMVYEFIQKSLVKNLASGKNIDDKIPCSPTYEPKGIPALNDGVFGLKDYNYNFLGWEGNHMEVIIDLEEMTEIHKINADFLQDKLAWIFLPQLFEVWTSTDKGSWEYKGFDDHHIDNKKGGRFTENFSVEIDPIQTRYIKIKATSLLKCPQWHVGANKDCWVFTDEIVVE